MTDAYPHHLFSLRVENKSGVLVRVAGLFARRGFNIVSLAVAPTDDERFSRISLVVDAESAPLHQVRDQLDKLVNVVEITEIEPSTAYQVELALLSVKNDSSRSLFDAISAHGAAVVGERPGNVVVKLDAHPNEIDAFIRALEPFGIIDLQRTGRITMTPS